VLLKQTANYTGQGGAHNDQALQDSRSESFECHESATRGRHVTALNKAQQKRSTASRPKDT
jgi:hypothetical protein